MEKLSLQNNSKLNWPQLQLSFYKFPRKLRTLHLDRTGLTSLSDKMFDGLRGTRTVTLTLSYNSIGLFNERFFYHLNKLRNLDLKHNLISGFLTKADKTRPGHKTIEFLGFACNNFEIWPHCFVNRETLVKLYSRI